MPSAQSVSNYQTNVEIPSMPSPDGYDARWTGNDELTTGKSWWSQIVRGVTGLDEEQRYLNALTENNRAYELALLKDQRAYEDYERNWNKYLDDTAVQRRVEDIKAAGLNPWLALQSGGIGASSPTATSTSTVSPGSGSSGKAISKSKSNGIYALAMLLMSSAKLIATL